MLESSMEEVLPGGPWRLRGTMPLALAVKKHRPRLTQEHQKAKKMAVVRRRCSW